MKTSIALVSAALLVGAALARPTPELRRPSLPKPIAITPAAAVVDSPEATSLLDTLVGAHLPSPEPEPIKEFIGIVSPGFNDNRDDGDPELLAIHRKLDSMKIDLAFENTMIEVILAFIRDFSGLNILLDAAVRDRIHPDRAITLKVKDLVLKNTLKLLLTPFQLDYRITEEYVVLIIDLGHASTAFDLSPNTRDILRELDPVTTPFDAVLDATRVDLDVQNWPLSAIIEELRRRTGLDLRLHHEVEGVLSVQVAQITLPTLLKLLLEPRNLTYEIDGVTIWIRGPRDPDRY